MIFKTSRLAFLVLVALIACSASKTYADSFQLIFTSGMSGTLNLTATPHGGGSFLVTSLTGNENGLSVGGIVPTNSSGYFSLPSGNGFLYDNLLFPSSQPIFDNAGLLFTLVGSKGLIYENLYSIGPSFYLESAFLNNGAPFPGSFSYIPVTFSLTNVPPTVATPEPSTGILFVAGVLALLTVVFARKLLFPA